MPCVGHMDGTFLSSQKDILDNAALEIISSKKLKPNCQLNKNI